MSDEEIRDRVEAARERDQQRPIMLRALHDIATDPEVKSVTECRRIATAALLEITGLDL